jgi:hypothetical protein
MPVAIENPIDEPDGLAPGVFWKNPCGRRTASGIIARFFLGEGAADEKNPGSN